MRVTDQERGESFGETTVFNSGYLGLPQQGWPPDLYLRGLVAE